MDFNFKSIESTNFASAAGQYLKPYEIYDVTLTKIEKAEIKGSKDPNAVYPVISLEFTGAGDNKGVFSTNLFIPNSEKDMERPVFKNNEGHEYNRPSHFENFQFTLMQIVHAINPAGEAKIKENASKIKTIDQFVDLIIKALKNKESVKTQLKLVGKNTKGVIYAALPSACGLTKDGEIFATNFIGDNLFFSNYELTQQKQYRSAKPTNMDKEAEADDNPDVGTGDDLNIDDLDV